MILSDEEIAAVFIDTLPDLENKKKRALFGLFDKPSEVLDAGKETLLKATDEKTAAEIYKKARDASYIKAAVKKATASADGVIALGSEKYPEELAETPVPPLVLYYAGNAELLKGKKIAAVGSRKTLPQYLKTVTETIGRITEAGITAVTGIADGADSAAIEGGLKNGRIISVLPGGLDKLSPKNKKGLMDEIVKKGLVVTECSGGTETRQYSYPVRNRIIAGLAAATLIVSGEEDSGARYTAEYAAEYGREVMCFPYGLGVPSGELCKSLVKRGAKLVETAEDVAEILGVKLSEKANTVLSEKERLVYETIRSGINRADKIVEKTGLKIYELMPVLGMLELKGLTVRNTSGEIEIF